MDEKLIDRLWRETGLFDVVSWVTTMFWETWYAIPLAIGMVLGMLLAAFLLARRAEKRHLARRREDSFSEEE